MTTSSSQDSSKPKSPSFSARLEADALLAAAIVESTSDAIVTKNLSGIITSWNPSAERIFGYKADEVIGQPITILFPPDHINEEPQIIQRIKQGELVEHYETIRRRKDGTLIPLSLTISPLRNMDGVIVGASKIARDITRQKEYETQLVNQANELEQFAYVASHDLKEPLRKIAVYTELLTSTLRAEEGSDVRKYSNFISESVKRMQKLITDLLEYSRSSRGDVNQEQVDLNDTLNNVMEELEVPIKESHVRMIVRPLPTVTANNFHMNQILQNLISNAIKFRYGPNPEIEVASKESNNEYIISVRDNGIGIEKKYQQKIFRIFQRLHSRDKYPGTGIGLAICAKIVDHHGGKIWVESEIGQGATFFFTLPKRTAYFSQIPDTPNHSSPVE